MLAAEGAVEEVRPITLPAVDEPTPLTAIGPAAPAADALTLGQAESLALGVSPSLAAIEAQARAARWQCVQAGLPPNPNAGYLGSEIGNEGAAGQQGAYVSQRFVRGGKLTYAQAVASKEARRLEQALAVERLRVLTDVRTAFYEVYLSRLEVDLAAELTGVSRKAADASKRLHEAGEGRRTDSLQAEIEYQRAAAARRRAEQGLLANWRRLAALTELPAESPRLVAGDREELLEQLDWQATTQRVMQTSPAIAERVAAIEKARCEIAVQRAVAVPDVTAQVSVQYDDATDYTVTGVQVGMPLVLWNRNQGGVGRAQAELTASMRRLEATEQTLERRLAEVYGRYQTAYTLAEALRTEVLPRAQDNLDLATEGYVAGEYSFLELLTVQRTFFEVNLESLAALRELNATNQLLRGCLLEGSGVPE